MGWSLGSKFFFSFYSQGKNTAFFKQFVRSIMKQKLHKESLSPSREVSLESINLDITIFNTIPSKLRLGPYSLYLNQWKKWWIPHKLIFVELEENLLLAGDQLLYSTTYLVFLLFMLNLAVDSSTRFTWQDLTQLLTSSSMIYFLSLASRHYTYQIFFPPDWFL